MIDPYADTMLKKKNQDTMRERNLYVISIIEIKSKYCGLEWNSIIVIVNKSMCGLYEYVIGIGFFIW